MSRLVLATGCFDPLHYGHVLHFRAARKAGDKLIVAVTRDARVAKGADRPLFPEAERADMVREQRCVDDVILVDGALEALYLVWPQVFALGEEYEGKVEPAHFEFCREHGVDIVFTREKRYSSTALLRHYDRSR